MPRVGHFDVDEEYCPQYNCMRASTVEGSMLHSRQRSSSWRTISLLAAFVVAMVGGCSAPQYDAQTDKLITTLQADTDTQFVTLISLNQRIADLAGRTDDASKKALADARARAAYDANSGAYDKLQVELTSVRMRVDAAPNKSTPLIDKALMNLDANLFGEKSLRSTHREQDSLGSVYLVAEKGIIDQQLLALLTYELVLKNGSTGAGSGSN